MEWFILLLGLAVYAAFQAARIKRETQPEGRNGPAYQLATWYLLWVWRMNVALAIFMMAFVLSCAVDKSPKTLPVEDEPTDEVQVELGEPERP